MSDKRYIHHDVPLTPEQSLEEWKERVLFHVGCVDSELSDLRSVLNEPLPKTKRVYLEVGPEDPRYATADPNDNLIGYISTQPMRSSPWIGLVKSGEFPHGLGDTTSTIK